MEGIYDPLKSLSNQLPEYAAAPQSSPILNQRWSPVGGSTSGGHQGLRKSGAWNPMDEPDFDTVYCTDRPSASFDAHVRTDSDVYSSYAELLDQHHSNWQAARNSFDFSAALNPADKMQDISNSSLNACYAGDFDSSSFGCSDEFNYVDAGSYASGHPDISPLLSHDIFGDPRFRDTSGGRHDQVTASPEFFNTGPFSPTHLPQFQSSTVPFCYSPDKYQPESPHFSHSSAIHSSDVPQGGVTTSKFCFGVGAERTSQSSTKGLVNDSTTGSIKYSANSQDTLLHSFTSSRQQQQRVIPSGGDMTKPSYSDVAKSPKVAHFSGSRLDQLGPEGITNLNAGVRDKKHFEPSRKSSGFKIKSFDQLTKEAEQAKVPDSEFYGLDNFRSCDSELSKDQLMGASKNKCFLGNLSRCVNSVDTMDGYYNFASAVKSERLKTESFPSSAQSAPAPNPPLSVKPTTSSKDTVFFDPKRIFQSKNTNTSSKRLPAHVTSTSCSMSSDHGNSASTNSSTAAKVGQTILNNDKLAATSSASSKLSGGGPHKHDYINNDLRDVNKLTNQALAEGGKCPGTSRPEDIRGNREPLVRKTSGQSNGMSTRHKQHKVANERVAQATHRTDDHQNTSPDLYFNRYRPVVEEWCRRTWVKLFTWLKLTASCLLKITIFVLYVVFGLIYLLLIMAGKVWTLVKARLVRSESNANSGEAVKRRVGLEQNIILPTTGEEAMKRLLAFKGRDPYSILGLRADSSDDDIKKFYKKQAFLVHPDKNQDAGAEEAFKILGRAFEMIGEPTKRKQYDSHTQEASEAEAMKEFADMLSKLQEKLQEAANIMQCDKCEGKHKRVPVSRPFYSARFCQRCSTWHAAKEGDVWAESSMLGFLWHYYALMEGQVYDITDWMKCHKEEFNQMKANIHHVMYKIDTGGARRNRRHQGEPNLEDLMNHLFKYSSAATEGQRQTRAGSQAADGSWGSAGSQGSATTTTTTGSQGAASTAKKAHRKKKHR